MKSKSVIKFILGFLAAVGVLILIWARVEGPLRDPHDALLDFYEAKDRAEDQLMDPLILTGHRVVPLLMENLPNKEMRLRRYAIGFLGNGGYVEALPTLERILKDESEIYYFRADALLAIYQISKTRAKELASLYVNGQELLGRFAGKIVADKNPVYFKRSYWDAFRHVHERAGNFGEQPHQPDAE